MKQSLGVATLAVLFASIWIVSTQPLLSKSQRPISNEVLRFAL